MRTPSDDGSKANDVAEDRAATEHRAKRNATRRPDLAVAEATPIFGLFAGKPEFGEAIDRVIASRSDRYTNLT